MLTFRLPSTEFRVPTIVWSRSLSSRAAASVTVPINWLNWGEDSRSHRTAQVWFALI